jgi:glycosyltransferase involved in cell wall biosynthesis
VIRLSVVIITFNEEHNIGRCIASVKDIADEIVVVDSFSSDATEAICKAHGVRVIQHKFEGHIEQKNYALTHASYPYVLSLDADEALSDTLKNSLLQVKERWTHDGYMINRLTNYCGAWIRHGGWYPDRKLRLFDKRKGQWTGINPHDRFELFDRTTPVGYLQGDILHYSYYSISGHVKQVDYFTEVSARMLFQQGKKPGYLRLVVSPFLRFLRDYLIKGGFLDGYYGFVICTISAHAVFLKYVKLNELHKDHRERPRVQQ